MVLYNGLIVDAQKQSSPPCICKLTHSSVRVLLSMLSQMHSFTRVYWAAGTKKINSLLCLWLWDINWIFSWFCASLSWFLHQLVDYRQNGEHPSFGSSVSFSRPGWPAELSSRRWPTEPWSLIHSWEEHCSHARFLSHWHCSKHSGPSPLTCKMTWRNYMVPYILSSPTFPVSSRYPLTCWN